MFCVTESGDHSLIRFMEVLRLKVSILLRLMRGIRVLHEDQSYFTVCLIFVVIFSLLRWD